MPKMLVCVTAFAIRCRNHKLHVFIYIEIVCTDILLAIRLHAIRYPTMSHGVIESLVF